MATALNLRTTQKIICRSSLTYIFMRDVFAAKKATRHRAAVVRLHELLLARMR
jgi:hypothetical protein